MLPYNVLYQASSSGSCSSLKPWKKMGTKNTEPMDRTLLWIVQSQDQWRVISTELSPDRHRGRPSHPSQRNGGVTTIIQERNAQDHVEQMEAASGEDHRWITGSLQSRKEHHWADLQPNNRLWEISPVPARPLPYIHRFQEGLRQGLACNSVSNHEEVQHQRHAYPSHQKPL